MLERTKHIVQAPLRYALELDAPRNRLVDPTQSGCGISTIIVRPGGVTNDQVIVRIILEAV
jgi:hypothetical protein